jgi:hypothetical protein
MNSSSLSPRARFMAAVNHQDTDRIPMCMDAAGAIWPYLSKALGVTSKEECYKALEIIEWMLDPDAVDPIALTITRHPAHVSATLASISNGTRFSVRLQSSDGSSPCNKTVSSVCT